MRELHVVALSEDGRHVQLATSPDAVRGGFRVLIDERLAAAVRGDLPRPGETVVRESALPVKEIQARLRAGETAAEIARSAGTPVARVERWAAPIESEKQQVVLAARRAVLVRGRRGPSVVPLGEAVDRHLDELPSLKPDSVRWTARRGDEPRWTVEVSWYSRGKTRTASWVYDPHAREVTPTDSASAALGHVDADPAARPARAAAAADGPADAGPRLPGSARRAPTASAFPRTSQSREKAARGSGAKRALASGTVTPGRRPAGTEPGESPLVRRTRSAPATAAPAAPAAVESEAPATGRTVRARGASAAPPAAGTPSTRTRSAAPAAARTSATRTAASGPAAKPAAKPAAAKPAAAKPAAAKPAAAKPAAQPVAAQPAAPAALPDAPPVEAPVADELLPAGPPALRVVGEEDASPRPARRGRAAVPSWDEVLLSTARDDARES